jgi:hypothetical protein
MATDIGGVWRTVGGRRIFIKDGEDLSTAMKNSGKFKKNDKLPHNQSYEDVAYHASDADFNEFDISKIGTGQGENTQGNGINLASDDSVQGVYGKILYKVEVNLKNAYTVENKKLLSTFEKDFGYKTDMDNISDELKKKGYDGIVQKIPFNNNKLYTVFDSKNVKIIKKKK